MKMAGTIPKVIDDKLLSCQLCMKSLTTPKLLPCMHAFCESCLEKYIKTFAKEKRNKSVVLDIKVVEDVLKGGLDCEIPVHGYDDVVGNYPSLPRISMVESQFMKHFNDGKKLLKSPLSKKLSKDESLQPKEHEYSEIPPTEEAPKYPKKQKPSPKNKQLQNKKQLSVKNPSVGVYTLEKPTTSPSYIPMNRPPRSKSDPVEQFKTDEKLQLSPKSQSARSSALQSEENSENSAQQNNSVKDGANTYIPMGSPKTKPKDKNSSEPTSPSSPGITYEPMDSSIEAETEESGDTYLENNFKDYPSNNLTGFGFMASPVSISLFKNCKSKVDPVYQLEKPKGTFSKSGKRKSKLSKKTSKSVDILASRTAVVENVYEEEKGMEKQSSDADMHSKEAFARPLSGHMKHSVSTPYIGQHTCDHNESIESSNNDPIPDSLLPRSNTDVNIHAWHSDCWDQDGYETPINKRKLNGNNSPLLTELEIDTTTQIGPNMSNAPCLPPKRHQSEKESAPSVPSRTERGNHSLTRSRSDDTPGTKRRQGVGNTIMFPSPTNSEPEPFRAGEITRDSVFDHIYEEIQCDGHKIPLNGPSPHHGLKHVKKVPMMKAISSDKSHVSMQTLLRKHNSQNQAKMNNKSNVDVLNPHTQKVHKLLKKNQHISENMQNESYDMPIVGLQIGNKLMRKSQTLLDDHGHSYISDLFEKVHVQHNNEEIELMYAEVRAIEQDISSLKSERSADQTDESSDEFMCPTCSANFTLPVLKSVSSLQTCTFLDNLKETRRLENNLKPICKDCNIKADYKCLDCDFYLCKKCNDSHNWYKVVHSHQVMTLTQLQSGMYTTQIMSQKQDVCPNHTNEAPQYYCDTCTTSICKECCHCYHTGHKCQLISDVAKRGTAYLENFESMTGHISNKFKAENLQIDKYRLQYNSEKLKAISQITRQYVHARELLDDAYQELLRHVDFRYSEEAMYLEQVQKRNEQFLSQIDQTNKLAEHATEYGNQCDVISIAKAAAQNLLSMEKLEPICLEHKMDISFSPLESVRPVDILPLLGQTTREYKAIKKREQPESPIQKELRASKEPVKHLHLFTPKTPTDKKGCKPTGIALTKEDNIVLVDDINKKIKIFNEDGSLVREIVPLEANELVDPWDVTVTNYGNFAVTDRGSKQVKIFDPDGDLVCHFGPHLANPWGICCNKDGDLLVTDTHHKCVFVHDSNGNLKYRIDPPSNMAKFPEYVTTNSYSDIIVSDLKAHCIYVFNLLGQFLFKIGPKDLNNPRLKLLHSPCGVYCDQQDNILVADYEMMRVSKFDKNGRFISHFLTFLDELRAPQSVIVNKKDHVILSDGNFIKTFSTDPIEFSDLAKQEVDLELKPKVYNIRKGRNQSQEEETSKSLSDGEGENPELNRQEPLRRTVHVTSRRSNFKHQKDSSNKSQGHLTSSYKSNNRSSSVPPRNSNIDAQSSIKTALNYDTPKVSVEKIKEKLSSLERSTSPPERETSPVKAIETAKVSVQKVKEQLNNQSKPTIVKPKLRPKPSLKQDSATAVKSRNNIVSSATQAAKLFDKKKLSAPSQDSKKQSPTKTHGISTEVKNLGKPKISLDETCSNSVNNQNLKNSSTPVSGETGSVSLVQNKHKKNTESVIIGETVDSDGWQEDC